MVNVMAKHLELDDRIAIQTGLKEGKSISAIAKDLNRDKATVSREIKSRRYLVNFRDEATMRIRNACIHRYNCNIKNICKSQICYYHKKYCRLCGKCVEFCESFKEEHCSKLEVSPYVCNGCSKKPRCTLSKWLYDAKKAQNKYENVLSESRQGIGLNERELSNLNKIVSPLLKNGQSVRHICRNNAERIILSEKSIYTYIHNRLLSADNFDLRRTVQRKVFKKAGPPLLVDKKCRQRRTYDDFKKYLYENPDVAVVEMDTVEGNRGGKVILTLLIRNCGLQLGFLRDANTSSSVTNIFQTLKMLLTSEEFSSLFPVILTDRGSEFSDPLAIELDFETGEILTNVFYCDPQNTNQKSQCERNHEFIRYILPKGKSFDLLEQKDITKMMNHINSYRREKFNNKSPIELFETLYGTEIKKKLGLELIPPNDIVLTPALLK